MKKPKQLDTCTLIEQYQKVWALLQTWEDLPAEQRMAAEISLKCFGSGSGRCGFT